LTPYRAASKQIMAVLQRFGPAEKLGLDEVFVDATAEASGDASSTNQPVPAVLADVP
jgi:DNA polymerase iota